MTNETFNDIEKLEADLWEAADNLRANSKLTSSDYFMPVEIYDEMAEAMQTGKPYQPRIDPPPAGPRVAHPPKEGPK
jgi:hypothetical protein